MTISDEMDFIVSLILRPSQKRRLYMHLGVNSPTMTLRQIAKVEHVSHVAIRKSLNIAKNKILSYAKVYGGLTSALKGEEGRRSQEVYVDPKALDSITQDQPLGWGQPAQICMARFDKTCPRCGRKKKDGFEQGERYAYCPDDYGCTWSYCFEDEI